MAFRRATDADVGAIVALTRQAYAKWVPVIGREPKPMTANYEEAVGNHRIDLLDVSGNLAGLVEMIPGADHLLIENVAVAPVFQGRGLGKQLLAHAEGVAAALRLGETRLYTNALFTENVLFYRRLGYRIDREEVSAIGVTVHMSRNIG